MDYSKYFTLQGNSLVFTGDTLEVFVPDRYSMHGYLDISGSIKTIGVFDMLINGSIPAGYLLAGQIEIMSSNIEYKTVGTDRFVKATLHKNDIFIRDINVVRDVKISYVLFYEIYTGGHYPEFLTYERCATLFDSIAEVTGDSFRNNHMIFEMLVSMLHRDRDNLQVMYRNTDRTKPPIRIPMRMTAHVAQSTTGKIIGSYMKDGMDSALVNAADFNSDVEDLLRK
jgi:hypothetical protein